MKKIMNGKQFEFLVLACGVCLSISIMVVNAPVIANTEYSGIVGLLFGLLNGIMLTQGYNKLGD